MNRKIDMKIKQTIYPVALLMVCFFLTFPSFVQAKQAGILLIPTRIVMEKGDRYITVSVKNRGDATGAYRVEIIDMIMQEEGVIRELTEEEEDKYSARPLLRISPRKMILKPSESQNIRLMLRKPKGLEDGEYRSHLKVTLVEDNVTESGEPIVPNNVAIMIKPRFALIIPIIIREGKTEYSMSLDKPKLYYENNKPMLDLLFTREGNRSAMGDVTVTHISKGGTESIIKDHPGIAIYRSTEKRRVVVPLDISKNVSLKNGKLYITYKAQKEEEYRLLAETELILAQ